VIRRHAVSAIAKLIEHVGRANAQQPDRHHLQVTWSTDRNSSIVATSCVALLVGFRCQSSS
jgi:hypothetical protein